MGTISPFLRLTLQGFNENVDQWGNILNVSALECLEDAISGRGTVDVTSGNITLADTEGGPTPETGTSHSRWAILNIIGAPGNDTRQVITPARSKIYLIANNTSDNSDVTVIPTGMGATGVLIPDGVAQWVYCDGTDMFAIDAATATQATTASSATNATQLGGVAAANYALKATAQTFTAGQVVQRAVVTSTMGTLTINCALGNAFKMTASETFSMAAPINATDGQQFSLAIKQGGGGPYSISFAPSTFVSANGTPITLSTVANDVDYLAFEYVTALFNGVENRWVVSQLKDLGDL